MTLEEFRAFEKVQPGNCSFWTRKEGLDDGI